MPNAMISVFAASAMIKWYTNAENPFSLLKASQLLYKILWRALDFPCALGGLLVITTLKLYAGGFLFCDAIDAEHLAIYIITSIPPTLVNFQHPTM